MIALITEAFKTIPLIYRDALQGLLNNPRIVAGLK
jgi:hypothetical protein